MQPSSQDTCPAGTYDPAAVDQEIMRLEILMAKAKKLAVGSQANHDILVQLQCMIDRLETERDAGEDSKVGRRTCHRTSEEISARRESGLRGGARDEHDEVYSNGRHKAPAYDRSSSVHNNITPPIPLKNPARKQTKRDQRTTTTRLDPSRHLDRLAYNTTKLDRSIHCLEQLIQAQEENPYLKTTQATYGTAALVAEMERLMDWKDELGRKIELLTPMPSALRRAQRLMYMEPGQRRRSLQRHITAMLLTPDISVDSVTARLRGGGSAQSPVEDKSVNAGGNDAAPPVPRRNPARTRLGTTSSEAWFPLDSNIHDPAPRARSRSTHNPDSSAATPYRILNCQDWKWPHPNWMFDNLSPAEKISLLRERSHWLSLQKPIDVEDAEIDAEIVRLSSLIGLERDPETWHDPIAPGYDRLGNWAGGWVRCQEHRQRAAAQGRLRGAGHESYGFNTAK